MTRFKVGDAVCGSTINLGTYQQFVPFLESELAHKPMEISHSLGAAYSAIFLTAFQALARFLKINPQTTPAKNTLNGRNVLIIAGSGGIGSSATLLAKHYYGANRVLVIGSKKNEHYLKSLGCDHLLDYTNGKEALRKELKEYTGQIDIIIDGVDYKEYADIQLARNSDESIYVALKYVIPKETSKLFGMNQLVFHAMLALGGEYEEILKWMVECKLYHLIPVQELKLEEVNRAHLMSETHKTIGKIVLKIPELE